MAGDGTGVTGVAFQRARRPDQIQARREAIVATARQMLTERGVAEVSLRELSERIGLAKSNVLRYFDSREAIFLEILDQEWDAWLDAIEPDLAALSPTDGPFDRELAVGRLVAESLAARPLLCELFSTMSSVLERNIGLEFARAFKVRATAHSARLVGLVRAAEPELTDRDAAHFGGAVNVIVSGLWPYAHPSETVTAVTAELGLPPAGARFVDDLAEGFENQLIGLVARRREGVPLPDPGLSAEAAG